MATASAFAGSAKNCATITGLSSLISAQAWITPTNAQSTNDNTYTSFADGGLGSQALVLYNFGITGPSGSDTINGIQLDLWIHDSSSSDGQDVYFYLTKTGNNSTPSTVGSNKARSSTSYWPTSNTDVAGWGGSSDLWGTTWSASDVTGTGFGIIIVAQSVDGSQTLYVDAGKLTVTYTPSGGGGGGAGLMRAANLCTGAGGKFFVNPLNRVLVPMGKVFVPGRSRRRLVLPAFAKGVA